MSTLLVFQQIGDLEGGLLLQLVAEDPERFEDADGEEEEEEEDGPPNGVPRPQ